MSRKQSSAFTLVEVLVVVTILAVLLALSFPALSTAFSKSGTTVASNKLKQLAMAANSYANDNNDFLPFPRHQTRADGVQVNVKWIDALAPYMNDAIGTGKNEFLTSPNADTLPGSSRHFSLNKRIFHPNWGGRRARVPNPAGIILFAECNRNGIEAMDGGSKPVYSPNESASYRISNPGKVGLYAFVDGHVEALVGNRGWNVSNNSTDDSPDTTWAEDKFLWQWWN